MLRKKAKGVAIGSQTSSFIGKVTEKVVDRRAFLKGSDWQLEISYSSCVSWFKR